MCAIYIVIYVYNQNSNVHLWLIWRMMCIESCENTFQPSQNKLIMTVTIYISKNLNLNKSCFFLQVGYTITLKNTTLIGMRPAARKKKWAASYSSELDGTNVFHLFEIHIRTFWDICYRRILRPESYSFEKRAADTKPL
jgi:hypothetical protein